MDLGGAAEEADAEAGELVPDAQVAEEEGRDQARAGGDHHGAAGAAGH